MRQAAGIGTRRGALVAVALASLVAGTVLADPGRAVRPADELFWTPTLEQAIEMASANGVPIFVMGYSLVGERSTYTKLGEECASTVF